MLTGLDSRQCQDCWNDQDIEDDWARLQHCTYSVLLPICLLHDPVEYGPQESSACDLDGILDDGLGYRNDVSRLGPNQRTIDRMPVHHGTLRVWLLPSCSIPLHPVVLSLRVSTARGILLLIGDACWRFLWHSCLWS